MAGGAGRVLGRWGKPVPDLSQAARHAVYGMGTQLVHLQPSPSVPDLSLRGGREGRAGCHPCGPAGLREEHALRCLAGTRLAVVFGRVGLARPGAWPAAADTATGGAKRRLYRTGRAIASGAPDRAS